jgi:type I restriction enzyme S subunit
MNSHSAVPGLNRNDVYSLKIPVPTIPEQRAIASVLSSLDDKIDLLHRQNKTLEAMAEALFRRLFLERVGKLGQITELIEINPLRKLAKGQLAPYLEMSNVNTTVFHPVNWYLREFTSGMRFINGDTLFGRITPCLENGKAVYVTFLEKGQVGWGSTEFIVLRSKGQLHPFFTYTLVKCRDFRDYAEGCFEGSSGRQRVNVDHLSNFEIHIPEESAIKDFNVKMEAIAPKLHLNFMQIRILEKLRDTLLPKLMSGEVMVDYS